MLIARTTLSHFALANLQEKVEKLNRIAKKRHLEPLSMVTTPLPFVAVIDDQFLPQEEVYRVELSGVEPCINGWRLLAKIEFDDVLGNIVKVVPRCSDTRDGGTAHSDSSEVELNPKYRTIQPICEHCNTLRKRKDIFVLQHDTEGEKVVGRNCLADFLRDGDAESLIEWATLVDKWMSSDEEPAKDDGGYGGFGGIEPTVGIVPYLTLVACIIRKLGWVSRQESQESGYDSTSNMAAYCYGRTADKFIRAHELYPEQIDYELAEKALEWAKTLRGRSSEYLHTLGQIAQSDQLVWRYAGYTASIIQAYRREQDMVEARKAKAPRVLIGTKGERLRGLPATVVRTRSIDGNYGVTTVVTFEVGCDENGTPSAEPTHRAVLTWFGSGDLLSDYVEGETYQIDATVKKHEQHERYGDSTIVSRVAPAKPPKKPRKTRKTHEAA
jgi:hypothetical protein